MEKKFDRRSFLKGAAIGAMGMMPMTSMIAYASEEKGNLADTAPEAEAAEQISMKNVKTDERMTLAELNDFRQRLVDAQTDYTCEDGSVVPAVYVKLRALMNSYGWGMGSAVHDHAFDEFVYLFSEDEAQAYLEMPFGVRFTATDFAVKSGRDEDECLALCEDLASRALLFKANHGGIPYFHHMAMAYGLWEYVICIDNSDEYANAHNAVWGEDAPQNKMGTETPFYYSIPSSRDVVVEDEVYPFDDWERIVERHSVFAVAPCQCQLIFSHGDSIFNEQIQDTDVLLERCLLFGENAEFCIASGAARQITKEECREIMEYCRDEGMVFHTTWTKDPDVICNCHRDICGILSTYRELGDAMADFNTCENLSHYDFEYDKDVCIQCGLCMAQCPVECITMDDEGYPQRKASCVRCGQCGIVCPQGARKLSLRDLTNVTPLSDTMLDDYNLKADYRIRNGLLTID